MGGLIVAVVGGFLALLLRGGGLSGSPAPTTATQPSIAAPVTPPIAKPPVSSTNPKPPAAQTKPPAPSPQKPLEVPALPSSGEPPRTTAITPPTSRVTPAASSKGVNGAVAVKPSSTGRKPTPKPALAAPRQPPAVASREPGNYARADFLRNYRIATGTYSSASRAGLAARKLRALGFPAQAFSSGTSFIVVVGPYARESSARAAFAKLRAGNPDAVLYSPNGSKERAAPSSAAPKPAAKPPTAVASSGQPVRLDPGMSFLQVGAFNNVKSALPLLERLKGAGFKALLRAASDGFTRVLVGPYAADNLQSAKTSLSSQGLTPFPVKQ